jgi:hypothetical protein
MRTPNYRQSMSPKVVEVDGITYYFFSNEEHRMHMHVRKGLASHPEKEAKIWLEPNVSVASNSGFSASDLRGFCEYIEEHYDVFVAAWVAHGN